MIYKKIQDNSAEKNHFIDELGYMEIENLKKILKLTFSFSKKSVNGIYRWSLTCNCFATLLILYFVHFIV